MTTSSVVLITGTSSGIGYELALAFARRGIHVAGTARRADRLNELAEKVAALPAGHGEFLPIAADVRDATAMQAAVQQTIERFGRLDILVANAGLGQRGSVVESDWNDLETVLRTNIDGVMHSIRAAVPEIRKAGGGHVILISSVVYNIVGPYMAIYAASKAFVSSLAHSLRLELKSDNIIVTDIIVGRTETEFNESRRGQSGRASSGKGATRVPVQSAADVAEGIVKAAMGKRKTVTLRWYDKLLVLGNAIIPDVIGRLSMRQYKS